MAGKLSQMSVHECDPQPEPPGLEMPPDWRCPECGRLWVPEALQRGEPVSWTWTPFDAAAHG